ncbi:hypothetical protein P691DRAFT_754822 [Macrolepiota fuliginosa MF-IS2]|uniref:Calcium channel YVC1 n=1 Tax=Macrolepiota fuliginosa MF-IS2 TaxID=1400762 RepID=A0A9P5XRF2_9AGAR|nr:hypothetical protein P691DRAFT_754822 [Macrolepiota fuliginosa MF-IS2]
MVESHPELQPLLRPEVIENTPVFPIIHMIRSDIVYCIDTPLTFEALTAPDLTYSLCRPLVEKYAAIQQSGNMSVVFCLLLNRVYFLRDENMTTVNISITRATLCEILATRVCRQLGGDMYRLALTLTTTWPVYCGADPAIIAQAQQERDDDLENHVGNAIEMAILGKAKKFIKSSACQKVINAIWSGKCVYQAQSSHSILSDTYKRNPIHFYDPHKASLLDHYRLKVPAIRSVLEYLNFLLLFILFVIAIEFNSVDTINVAEMTFMIYALGFSLEKIAAMQEHGIRVYFKGTWNGFDLAFVTIYCIYATLRLYGVYHHTFVTLKDNLMVLSLRAMFTQFMILMFIAVFCFTGFFYALWTLSRDGPGYSAGTISWWMLDLYFGLDASGFDQSASLHPVLGPILMVTYACLSNTLLLTVLVSILSNTFAHINEDAAAEVMFRKAVSTIEGVKADSLFSYQPPINVLALCVMLPASYLLSPRWFHKVNVFVIRATNFPILLLIAVYERQAKRAGTTKFYDTLANVAEKMIDTLPRPLKRMTIFEGLAGSDADIDAIFEIDAQFDSALDTESNEPVDIRIENSRRRSSASTSTKMPTRGGHRSESPSPHRPVPRLRVDSLFNRPITMPQSFASPLAQIYPPLVENIPEEQPEESNGDHTPSTNPTSKASGASSVPFARKRNLSMQSPLATTARVPTMGHSNPMQFRKPSGSTVGEKSPNLPLSPEQMEEYQAPTASAVEEVEENAPPADVSLEKRLTEIEKRQMRIETLLEQIVDRL